MDVLKCQDAGQQDSLTLTNDSLNNSTNNSTATRAPTPASAAKWLRTIRIFVRIYYTDQHVLFKLFYAYCILVYTNKQTFLYYYSLTKLPQKSPFPNSYHLHIILYVSNPSPSPTLFVLIHEKVFGDFHASCSLWHGYHINA